MIKAPPGWPSGAQLSWRKENWVVRCQRNPLKPPAKNEWVKPSIIYCKGISKRLKLEKALTPSGPFPAVKQGTSQRPTWGSSHSWRNWTKSLWCEGEGEGRGGNLLGAEWQWGNVCGVWCPGSRFPPSPFTRPPHHGCLQRPLCLKPQTRTPRTEGASLQMQICKAHDQPGALEPWTAAPSMTARHWLCTQPVCGGQLLPSHLPGEDLWSEPEKSPVLPEAWSKVKGKSLSQVSLFVTLWALQSVEFSKPEY